MQQQINNLVWHLMTFIGLFTGDIHHERLRDEDDQLLQFAIQQSLMDGNTDPVEQVPV